jgi:hypothetical protein
VKTDCRHYRIWWSGEKDRPLVRVAEKAHENCSIFAEPS